MALQEAKKAYDEILKVLNKHRDICIFDIRGLEEKAKIHLFALELKDNYGLNINAEQVRSLDYIRLGDYKSIGWWGEKYRRTISWSVDGRQPEDELLFQISFGTGAYIFGDDYPTKLFQRFWLELKEFNPDYIDEANRGLYWTMQNAKDIFNSFDDILNKYREINSVDFKLRKIEKMKKELQQLETSI